MEAMQDQEARKRRSVWEIRSAHLEVASPVRFAAYDGRSLGGENASARRAHDENAIDAKTSGRPTEDGREIMKTFDGRRDMHTHEVVK